MSNLLSEAENLATFIMNHCSGKSGLLARYVDQKSNRIFGNALVSDLGDYIPFFYWLGRVSGKKRYAAWAENQIDLAIDLAQSPCGLLAFFNVHNIKPSKRGKMRLFRTYDMDDAVLGIILMHELTKKSKYLEAANRFFKGLQQYATKGGFICTHIVPGLELKVPLSMPNYCGVYIEEMCRLSTLAGKETLVSFAKRVANAWLHTTSFKKYGLFTFQPLSIKFSPAPFFINSLLKSGTSLTLDTAVTSKPNTNMLFGLIALYAKTKDAAMARSILKWLDSIQEKIMENNIFYSAWNTKTKKPSIISLEINHAVIDVLLEIYLNLGSEVALDLATKCAEAWLKRQNKCGLVAEGMKEWIFSPFKKKSAYMWPPDTSRLDSQVDFSIVLAKLYELTDDTSYLKASLKIVDSVTKWHKLGNGYCEFVNLETQEKLGFVIETKFLTLLLKLLLLHYDLSQGASIYRDPLLRDLVRDR